LKGIKSFSLSFGVDEIGNLKERLITNDIKKMLLQSSIDIDEKAKKTLNVGVSTYQHDHMKDIVIYLIRIWDSLNKLHSRRMIGIHRKGNKSKKWKLTINLDWRGWSVRNLGKENAHYHFHKPVVGETDE